MNRGKIIILLILTVAVSVSIYGIWFRHRQMRRVLESFSAPVAQLIGFSPEADFLELASADGVEANTVGEAIQIGDRKYAVINKKSVTSSKGFGKLRADLVRDSSYVWDNLDDAPDPSAVDWRFVLVLSDSAKQARLAFSPDSRQIMLLNAGPVLSIQPICEPTKELFAEQFHAPAK